MIENENFFKTEEKDNILFFEMNAPENNLMTDVFLRSFVDKVFEIRSFIENRSDIKGLVIYGSGRHFSVGADVPSLVSRTGDELEEIEKTGELPCGFRKQKEAFTCFDLLDIPVVSVVRGFCIGSGCEIAINSHIRICEPTARLGQPESTFGILPALGGIAQTAQKCGIAEAIDIVLSGELFNSAHAYEAGWADIICDKKQGIDTAIKLINFIDRHEKDYSGEKAYEFVADFLENGETHE
jgi:enoyl-CoA hydratase